MPDNKFKIRIRFLVNRIKERLWVKPLAISLLCLQYVRPLLTGGEPQPFYDA